MTIAMAMVVDSARAVIWRSDLANAPVPPRNEVQHAGALLYTPIRFCGASGVWLGGKWFLTARHAVAEWAPGSLTVQLPAHGGNYRVKAIHLPPDKLVDMALLELTSSPADPTVLTLNAGIKEDKQLIWMAGFGNFGPEGKVDGFGSLHCGNNRVNGVDKITARFHFSKPPEGESFEACPAMFDSGGPIFLVAADGQLILDGVIVRVTGRTAPKYGAAAVFSRVSPQAAWLQKIAPELKWRK